MNKINMKLGGLLASVLLICGCTAAPAATTMSTDTLPTTDMTTPATSLSVEESHMDFQLEMNVPEAGSISYEEYLSLDVEVQQSYCASFSDMDDFFNWLEEAQIAYMVTTPTYGDFEEGIEDWD